MVPFLITAEFIDDEAWTNRVMDKICEFSVGKIDDDGR